MLLSDAAEVIVGLTPERWDVVVFFMSIVAFCSGVLVAERF